MDLRADGIYNETQFLGAKELRTSRRMFYSRIARGKIEEFRVM